MSDTTSISPDLQACLVCDDVRQENTGKFILIGTFEGLASTKFPFMAPPFCIFTRWVGGVGNFKQSVALFAPDGITKIQTTPDIPLQFNNDLATATIVSRHARITFPAPGTYWIEVKLDGDLRLRYPLAVKQVEPPQQRPQA